MRGRARLGSARSTVGLGEARHGMAWPVQPGHGSRQGWAWRGKARRGGAWLGKEHGRAWHGEARRGPAVHGVARIMDKHEKRRL